MSEHKSEQIALWLFLVVFQILPIALMLAAIIGGLSHE